MMEEIRYVDTVGTYLYKNRGDNLNSSGKIQLLLGARLHIDPVENIGGWVSAKILQSKGKKVIQGFVELSNVSKRQLLKIFYLDVGQGDAILIEAEDAIVIIDGGPNKGFHTKLVERFESLNRADESIGLVPKSQLFINAIVVSHFDLDHYYGLVKVLEDPRFKIGHIYHNGLPRFSDKDDKFLNLGKKINHSDGSHSISTDLRGLDSAQELIDAGHFKTNSGNDNKFVRFLKAAIKAEQEGRLQDLELLFRRDPSLPVKILPDTGPDLRFEVLAPVTSKTSGTFCLPVFPDPHRVTASNLTPSPSESHTINGNSIVLRLKYKETSYLFGGDLNQPAQLYLAQRYPNMKPFKADVNKACHHGSSDFDLDYLKAVFPEATVFSSGDNGSYDHPLPDAMGAAAKHSSGDFPLVFSTELARETGARGIKLGHINVRSNGEDIVMAQKKEKPSLSRWHSFQIPYSGPFSHN